jgi:hypothetical protein
MREMTYDIPSGMIALALLAGMVVAMEIGYRLSRRTRGLPSAVSKRNVSAMQSSILGILALLLAFTLSISLQRFDQRSDAVVDEANAIGTAYLRTQLLRPPARAELQPMLRDYLALRVKATTMTTVEGARREAVLNAAEEAQAAIWVGTARAAEADPNPVTSGLFVQAINEMIDSYGRRDAGLNRHVPEVVLFLLYARSDGRCRRRALLRPLGPSAVARQQHGDDPARGGADLHHRRPRPAAARPDQGQPRAADRPAGEHRRQARRRGSAALTRGRRLGAPCAAFSAAPAAPAWQSPRRGPTPARARRARRPASFHHARAVHLIVFSTVPSSAVVCLLSTPPARIEDLKLARSRRARGGGSPRLCARRALDAVHDRRIHGGEQRPSWTGLVRNPRRLPSSPGAVGEHGPAARLDEGQCPCAGSPAGRGRRSRAQEIQDIRQLADRDRARRCTPG